MNRANYLRLVHDEDCPCCRPTPGPAGPERKRAPAGPERKRAPADLSANHIALWSLAGLAIGLLLAKLIDRLVDGPGVLAMFGTWS